MITSRSLYLALILLLLGSAIAKPLPASQSPTPQHQPDDPNAFSRAIQERRKDAPPILSLAYVGSKPKPLKFNELHQGINPEYAAKMVGLHGKEGTEIVSNLLKEGSDSDSEMVTHHRKAGLQVLGQTMQSIYNQFLIKDQAAAGMKAVLGSQ